MKKLINAAHEAMERSYSPYSKFPVGAALLTKDGRIFQGCNVENASYGLSNCAERSALFNAMSHGVKTEEIVSLAIIAKTDQPISPCGACRQVIAELMPRDAEVIMTNLQGQVHIVKVKDLLPFAFDSEALDV